MPVWLSLILSVFVTLGFFAAFYGLILLAIQFKRGRARPRIGVTSSDRSGELSIWLNWDSETFTLEVYRLRVTHFSPEGRIKEGSFTVTYDPPRKAPFLQPIELPCDFKELLSGNSLARRSMVCVEARTRENFVIFRNFRASKMRAIYQGHHVSKSPAVNALKIVQVDPPSITSLEYQELVDRKKKLSELEAQARAKAAKSVAAAKPQPSVAPTSGNDGKSTSIAPAASKPTIPPQDKAPSSGASTLRKG